MARKASEVSNQLSAGATQTLRFFGDTHGNFEAFYQCLEATPLEIPVIHLGDFGLWPSIQMPVFPRPFYWIAGNHEYWPYLEGIKQPRTLPEYNLPDATYCPTGTILEFGRVRVGCIGGGDSIDRASRRPFIDWFDEERVVYDRCWPLIDNGPVDILVTHEPPAWVHGCLGLQIPEWCRSAHAVERVWLDLGRPTTVSGHLHPTKVERFVKDCRSVFVVPIDRGFDVNIALPFSPAQA